MDITEEVLEITGEIPEGCFKVLVAGPREGFTFEEVANGLDTLLTDGFLGSKSNLVIIEGTADGVDTFAENWAKLRGVRFKRFVAAWKDMTAIPCVVGKNAYGVYNALAGHNRNTLMYVACDKGVVFWDGVSKGTRDMYNKLNKKIGDTDDVKLLSLQLKATDGLISAKMF